MRSFSLKVKLTISVIFFFNLFFILSFYFDYWLVVDIYSMHYKVILPYDCFFLETSMATVKKFACSFLCSIADLLLGTSCASCAAVVGGSYCGSSEVRKTSVVLQVFLNLFLNEIVKYLVRRVTMMFWGTCRWSFHVLRHCRSFVTIRSSKLRKV